jgi:hypothetical protein
MNNGIKLAIEHYSNAFVTALKGHLLNTVHWYTDEVGAGNGCSTCGSNEDIYLDLDIEKLLKQIDEFSEQFQKGL